MIDRTGQPPFPHRSRIPFPQPLIPTLWLSGVWCILGGGLSFSLLEGSAPACSCCCTRSSNALAIARLEPRRLRVRKRPTGSSSSSAAEKSPAISETPHVGFGAPFQERLHPRFIDGRPRALNAQEGAHSPTPKITVQDLSAEDGPARSKTDAHFETTKAPLMGSRPYAP